ncbi:MAG: beta-ketoacyl-ACP synthase III [Desulfuromonadaceae bacterium]|nr:beta-ketoacyl-ACP synthase III [Desulfuromonadaceae bacterium]
MEAYITALGSFLPNEPVSNDQIETVLGQVGHLPSRSRRLILRNNKIRQRYYAIDPTTRNATHTNAQLSAEAIQQLLRNSGHHLSEMELLCCGTSSPDQIMPGHASMVHGELGQYPCEVVSTAGICGCGTTALKFACLQVAQGEARHAVACGSELASSFTRAEMCRTLHSETAKGLSDCPELSFNADFLRWMLSDGAGATWIESQPATSGISLKVEWIDQISSAHELETCMYTGASKDSQGQIHGWREKGDVHKGDDQEIFLIKQDVKLLNEEIVATAIDRALLPIIEKRQLDLSTIDWFLPHYSSDYFRERLYQHMVAKGVAIPYEKWFTNLATKGNTGAASIYIMLEELFYSGRLKPGERLLCFVPESGRFSICYMLLTVV